MKIKYNYFSIYKEMAALEMSSLKFCMIKFTEHLNITVL